MRKLQVESAAVDVECLAEVLHAHGRAFDVPAGPARSPRAVPRRFAWFRSLPESEVAWIAFLAADLDASSRFHLGRIAVAELAVVRIASDVEINITPSRIGIPLVAQALHHLDHFAN